MESQDGPRQRPGGNDRYRRSNSTVESSSRPDDGVVDEARTLHHHHRRRHSYDATTRRAHGNSSSSESSEETAVAGVVLPDRPVHGVKESLFSSGSDFYNFRGLLNDFIILLVLSNAKSILDSFLTNGLMVDSVSSLRGFVQDPYTWPSLCLVIVSPIFGVFTLICEKLVYKKYISERTILALHLTNLVVIVVFPCVVILNGQPSPVGAVWALLTYTITWLKMVSYMQVNYWCRKGQDDVKTLLQEKEELKKELVWYPNNLKLSDLFYFLMAPTLCYELNYPRRPNIRKVFLLRRLVESIFLMYVLMFFFQQWIMPIVKSSVKPFEEMDYGKMVERIMALAVPNHLLWLLFFYWFFHSVLNVVAELLRFGDREFYKDFWNSTNISKFWSTWNVPVHRWATRHVYKPLMKAGYGRLAASVAVFGISAFFHELVISIALHTVKLWAFSAMLMQVPLAILTSFPITQGQIGNCIVWLSIVLGQPIAIIMYMHDYYYTHMAPQAEMEAAMGTATV